MGSGFVSLMSHLVAWRMRARALEPRRRRSPCCAAASCSRSSGGGREVASAGAGSLERDVLASARVVADEGAADAGDLGDAVGVARAEVLVPADGVVGDERGRAVGRV